MYRLLLAIGINSVIIDESVVSFEPKSTASERSLDDALVGTLVTVNIGGQPGIACFDNYCGP